MALPQLETSRLILRGIRKEDTEAIFTCWMQDEEVSRYMWWKASMDRKDAEEFTVFELEKLSDENWNRWIIVKKETKEIIGTCLLFFNGEENHWDISYNLGKKYWGNGYVTEAMTSVLSYAEREKGITEIETSYAKVNTASGRVLEKLSFHAVKEVPYLCNGGEIKTTGVYCRRTTRKMEKYRNFFTKEYLMGPNSFRLIDELLQRRPDDVCFNRTLDLGCGQALTSIFLANETGARSVFAFDLWIPATDNAWRIRENGLSDRVIPIHGDALDMPFAKDYFDAIVSVDSYHYFGCKKGIFAEKILPFVKQNGYVMIVIPGLAKEPQGEMKRLFQEWAPDGESELFWTTNQWETLIKEECGEQCEVVVREANCFDVAWQEWFTCGNEYGIRDQEFLSKGLRDYLNFVLLYVKKRPNISKF